MASVKVSYCENFSGKVDKKATQLHAIASLKVLLDATKPQDGVNGTTNPDGTITGMQEVAHDSGRASQGTEVDLPKLLFKHHYILYLFHCLFKVSFCKALIWLLS